MIERMAATLAILALVSMPIGARAQSAYVVQTDRMAALVDADGESVAEADAVFAVVDGAVYAVGSPGDYALRDAQGNSLSDERCEMAQAAGDDVVVYRRDGRYGAMDIHGNALVSPEWAQLTYAGEGAFLALSGDLYDDQPDEMICLSPDGTRVNTGALTADGLRAFHEGRMPYMQSDGQYGCVDARGRQVIPPQWGYIGDFSDGVAIASDGSAMGLIDTEGQVMLELRFDWIQRGAGRIAARTAEGALEVYSADGKRMLYEVEDAGDVEVCGGYVITRDGDAARLYNAEGACVLEAPAGALFYPGLDGQIILADGAWGEASQTLLNPDGSPASESCQRLMPLCGGRYASVTFSLYDRDSVRYGLMDDQGRALLPAVYREILPAGEDRLVLVTDAHVIFADLDGNALREWPVTETSAPSSEAGA